jgi:KaiC/GvpD/RAD55 family RecA-like ATPase
MALDFQKEVNKLLQEGKDKAMSIGMFKIQTANGLMSYAEKLPDQEALWRSCIYRGDVCIVFSDTNLGKTVFAVQMGVDIAKRYKVLYFDFEMSDKQFYVRYSDEYGNKYVFPDNFYRVSVDVDKMRSEDVVKEFEQSALNCIEEVIQCTGAQVCFIDNLTWLCANSEKSDAASRLMMRFMDLKKRYNLTLVVISHTPKLEYASPITIDSLAGSKKLSIFLDDAIAIGRSFKDENLRYIKQLKVRTGRIEFGGDNVITCMLQKDGAFLHFVPQGFSTEREHLRELTDKEDAEITAKIKAEISKGTPRREIAKMFGVTYYKVGKLAGD